MYKPQNIMSCLSENIYMYMYIIYMYILKNVIILLSYHTVYMYM